MMVRTAQLNNIPRLLFSKTVNSTKGGLQNWMSYQLMKQLDDVFCATEEDRSSLYQSLRPFKNIHAAGDTRYDQCLYRLQHGNFLKPLNNFNKNIFVAGSTWEGDEKILYPVIAKNFKDVSFIIAPHEPSPEHIASLEDSLSKWGLRTQLYSKIQSWDPEAVLIIDQVGILADLYKWGQFAFVGGSMDRSVHSVMEPLAQGLRVFVGPRHLNNREAITFKNQSLRGLSPVCEVRNSRDLEGALDESLKSWSPSHQLDLRMAVQSKTGASQIVLKWFENQLR